MKGASFGCVVGVSLVWGLISSAALAQVPAGPKASPPPEARPVALDNWLPDQRDPAGRRCERHAALEVGERIVLACGAAGLWVVKKNPEGGFTLLEVDDLGGNVVGLFERDGRIWAEIARLEAHPVMSVTGATNAFPDVSPSTPTKPDKTKPEEPLPEKKLASMDAPPEPPAKREGTVIEVGLGDVVVDLGSQHGIEHGDRLELTAVTREDVGKEQARRRTVVAVGTVTAVSEGYSRVRLGINERVPLGAIATPITKNSSNKRLAPPRVPGIWEVEFMARPFLALGEFGGGMLLDASAGYRFESDLHLEVAFRPFGYGIGEDKPSIIPVTTFAKLSYDRDLFEVGLGLGLQTVHVTGFGAEAGSGTLFSQGARIGARDGLHFDARSDVVLFHSRFEFAGFVGSGQIPVGQTSWLLLEGGGGSAGYAYGEFGVRVLLRGNGDAGSVFFTGSVGGVGIFQEQELVCGGPEFTFPCWETTTYAGPMLGAGSEWRF
jgi:hypothetical protein